MALSSKQRGVLRGIVVALGITFITIPAAAYWHPSWAVAEAPLSARLAFALKFDIILLVWFVFNIGILARQRFFNPEDIDGGGGMSEDSVEAKTLQTILQNTLEQTVLAIPLHLIWAVSMPLAWTASVPAAVLLFFTGRILFWRGYRYGAPGRALGFGLSFYPSVFMLLVVSVVLLKAIVQ